MSMMTINVPSYINNVSCDMCGAIDKPGYAKISIGQINHIICYECMGKLTMDMVSYAYCNLDKEMKASGYHFVNSDKDDTFEIVANKSSIKKSEDEMYNEAEKYRQLEQAVVEGY